MIIAGVILLIFGFLFCVTIIGAIFGIPMIIVGIALVIGGAFRHKTVIQNVVTVTNAPPQNYSPTQGVVSLNSTAAIIEGRPIPQIRGTRPKL